MRSYSFNEKLNILEIKTSENIDINDLIDHYEKIVSKNSLPKKLKVKIDCRNTKFIIDTEEIKKTFNALKNAVNKYEIIREAIIVDKPYETVIATLFQQYSEFKNYSFNIFSTDAAANRWLKIN